MTKHTRARDRAAAVILVARFVIFVSGGHEVPGTARTEE